MEQASSTIRIYVEGPAEKVGISAFSQKGCGLVETTTNEGTFGSLVNVWTNGVRTNRFGVHAGSESEQYIVAEVFFFIYTFSKLIHAMYGARACMTQTTYTTYK